IPKLRALDVDVAGVGYQGYGSAGGSWLLNGFIAMEMARIDSSVATLWGVHTGLSAGPVYPCGDGGHRPGSRAPHVCRGESRLLRMNRAAGGLGDVWWNADNLSPRRRNLDPQRPEEVDRQLHLLRHKCHLGAR